MIENSVCKRASDVNFRRSAIDGVTERIKLIRPQGLAFRRGSGETKLYIFCMTIV